MKATRHTVRAVSAAPEILRAGRRSSRSPRRTKPAVRAKRSRTKRRRGETPFSRRWAGDLGQSRSPVSAAAERPESILSSWRGFIFPIGSGSRGARIPDICAARRVSATHGFVSAGSTDWRQASLIRSLPSGGSAHTGTAKAPVASLLPRISSHLQYPVTDETSAPKVQLAGSSAR